MLKQAKDIIEYRVYDLPLDMPVILLSGDKWCISDVLSTRLHFHNCVEIGYCLSGNGQLIFENEELYFRAGDITIIPRHVPHTTCSQKGAKSLWSYIFLDMGAFINSALSPNIKYDVNSTECFPQNYIFSKEQHPEIHFIANRLLCEYEQKSNNWEAIFRSLTLILHYDLMRITSTEEKTSSSAKSKAFVLKPALEYIQQNYMEKISVFTLAEKCHLSETHFRRQFLAIMGTSPLNFINTTRINKACVLLDTTQLPIAMIADEVGVSSLASFNRNFHEITGISPREYRKTSTKSKMKLKQKYILSYKGWSEAEETPVHV